MTEAGTLLRRKGRGRASGAEGQCSMPRDIQSSVLKLLTTVEPGDREMRLGGRDDPWALPVESGPASKQTRTPLAFSNTEQWGALWSCYGLALEARWGAAHASKAGAAWACSLIPVCHQGGVWDLGRLLSQQLSCHDPRAIGALTWASLGAELALLGQ